MHPNNDQKIFEKLTFFDQNGVKKIFFYFSLNTLPTTFKINQAKKIFGQKIFLPKGIVRPLRITYALKLNILKLKVCRLYKIKIWKVYGTQAGL